MLVVDIASDDGVVHFVDTFEESSAVGVVFHDVAFVLAGEGHKLGVGIGRGDDDAMSVSYGRLGKRHVVKVFVQAQVLGGGTVGLEFAFHVGAKVAREAVVGEREDGLCAGEESVLFVDAAEVERDHAGEPTREMDQMRLPCQFTHCLEGASTEEEHTLVVVGTEFAVIVVEAFVFGEILLIVNEVDLHTSRWDRAHLDDELVVGIVDNKIHSRKANHLMELVFAFVDIAETRHENTYFAASFLDEGRQIATHVGILILRKKRHNLLIYKKYSPLSHNNRALRLEMQNYEKSVEWQNFFYIKI